MNERMKDWKNERLKERKKESMNELRIKEWKNFECMKEEMKEGR